MMTLSESAVARVKVFFQSEPEARGKSLRVSVEPGGCSGYQYSFAFDTKREGDAEYPQDGFSLLVDAQSAPFLADARVDYAESETGSGFKIHNPNVKKSCGCGQSYQF